MRKRIGSLLIMSVMSMGLCAGCYGNYYYDPYNQGASGSEANSENNVVNTEDDAGSEQTTGSSGKPTSVDPSFDPGAQTSFDVIDTPPAEPTVTGYKAAYTQKISGSLHNPGMGWITLEEQTQLGKMDLGKNGDIPEADNVGIQTSWDLIERTPGTFDWAMIDETIEYWTAKGKRINLRICTDSLTLPEIYYGAPRWLYDMGVDSYSYDYNTSGDSRIIVTDVTNPTYKHYFRLFMDALAEKYADNPAVDTIDIRGYGAYGEWHSGYPFATKAERVSELREIVDVYATRFAKKNKTLFLSCSWSYQDSVEDGTNVNSRDWYKRNNGYQQYLDNSAFDYALTKYANVGYRRDGLAGGGCTKYATDEKALWDLIRCGKHAVNCGEFYNGYDSYVEQRLGCASPLEATEELLYKSRCNYSTVMGWLNNEVVRIVNSGDEEVFNRGSTKMGYRFKVEEAKFPEGVKVGDEIELYSKISNSGLGRFPYEGYRYGYMLIDSHGTIAHKVYDNSFDLRQLLNGEIVNVFTKFTVPSLPDDTYTLAAFIADETGEPAIRLGQVGNYDSKLYPLGTMGIGNFENQPVELYTQVSSSNLESYQLDNNAHYEATFEYTPSVQLINYIMGDDNGFEVRLVSADNTVVVCNWQDVSETRALKTVTFDVPASGSYHLEIVGTGIYQNKISVDSVKFNKKSGSLTDFENGYHLGYGAWVGRWDGEHLDIVEDSYKELNGSHMLELINDEAHDFRDILYSRLDIKPNTAYNLSFQTKGSQVGGNGCYYYVKLQSNGHDVQTIGEWYDRPDAPATNKSFSFVAPSDGANMSIVFGIKNDGAYYLDNIHLNECSKGTVVTGPDRPCDNNVQPFDQTKGLGKTETFENRVLPDCSFTYGFSRWGFLTTKKDEVIEGNYSLCSYIEPITYYYQDGNNFYEFCYSNKKYIKLEAGATYTLEFDYRKITDIKLVSDPSADGWVYITCRSDTTKVSGSTTTLCGADTVKGTIHHYTCDIQIPSNIGSDAYIIIGVYGRGTVIMDNMRITKK